MGELFWPGRVILLMELSIVIPAYSEAHKIARDVDEAGEFLQRHHIQGEIIVADDGSPDGTADVAENTPVPEGVELRVLRLTHKGKGWAVREGMKVTRGELVMFADSGLCIPFDEMLEPLAKLRRREAEIANGSRKLPDSVITRPQTLTRRIISRMFRWTTHRYMSLPYRFSDTQCGFKLYRGDVARELYGVSRTDGFVFDMEIVLRALARGYRIIEFPVHWTCDPDSRLRPGKIFTRTLVELRNVKKMLAGEKHSTVSAPAETVQ